MADNQMTSPPKKTNRGLVPRKYCFEIEDPASRSEDARLAKKWGCAVWGRGGTRHSLYGLLDHPTETTADGNAVRVVSLVQESGLVAVRSVSIVQDFVRASEQALRLVAKEKPQDVTQDYDRSVQFTRDLVRSVDSIACDILTEEPSSDIEAYRTRIVELADQLHTMCVNITAVFDSGETL